MYEFLSYESIGVSLITTVIKQFNTGHIEGAILIPDIDILEKAEKTLTHKSATILVYCRSDRRSALAAVDLVELRYSNVYDLGGIIDWKYDIVTE